MTTEQPELEPTDETQTESLADTDESQEDRGRIGYGRNERTSSWMLGLVLILLVVGIGAYQYDWFGIGDDNNGNSSSQSLETPLVGAEAPDFTL